ncbi:MAG: ABC transporter permease, partial [Pseudomonadota bacterium]
DLYATLQKKVLKPNTVQQHVPAWTIFGMFLIIIPIAGVMIKEREQGILQRFYVAPVSRVSFLFGRIISFVMVNLIQLVLMLLIGIFFFPLFDLPALNVVGHIGMISVIGICVAFAATGFGVMMGTWAKTFEQAMAFGPILIVIAAALGGIFVPSFLMPNVLKDFLNYSPLYWANNAFMDILVRGEGFLTILPNLLKLLGFFFVTLILTTFKFMRKV